MHNLSSLRSPYCFILIWLRCRFKMCDCACMHVCLDVLSCGDEKEGSHACSGNHDIPLQFVNKTGCLLCCVLCSLRNERVHLKKTFHEHVRVIFHFNKYMNKYGYVITLCFICIAMLFS